MESKRRVNGLNRTRVGIIVGFVLFAAYLIWNYRDEYDKTYVYREVTSADAAAYVPAAQQPKAEGITVYKLARKEGEARPFRYVVWSKQSEKEHGFQKAQLKKSADGLTVSVKAILAQEENEVKTDLILFVESEKDLTPILVYSDNKRAPVTEVKVP